MPASWRCVRPWEPRTSTTRVGRARKYGRASIRHSRWRSRCGAELFNYRGDTEELRRLTKEADQVGRDSSPPVLWAILGPAETGISLIREGRAAEGVPLLKSSMAIWKSGGGMVWSPYANAVLAEGMALLGDIDGAIQLIDKQIAIMERPGWEERCDYAEILRLKGWMLLLKGEAESAEKNYLASLEFARRQRAKSWELRTAMSLATLSKSQGRHEQGYALLAPVYELFTEDFDARDLREAKTLLEELSA